MPRILITEEDKKPQPYRIKLSNKSIKIGRADNCLIKLTDPNTSSHHCTIVRVKGGFLVEDAESTNGVLLEGEKYKYIDLFQDTEFFLGDVKVDFTFNEDEYDILSDEEPSYKQIKLEDYNQTEAEEIVIGGDSSEDEEEEDKPAARKLNTGGEKKSKSPTPLLAKSHKVTVSAGAKPALAAAGKSNVGSSGAIPPSMAVPSESSNSALFLILCVIAVLGGFCLKHYQVADKNFLLSNIFGEKLYIEQVPAPAPAQVEAPAE